MANHFSGLPPLVTRQVTAPPIPYRRLQAELGGLFDDVKRRDAGLNPLSEKVVNFIKFTEGEADDVYAQINKVSNLLDWIWYLLRQYVDGGISGDDLDLLKRYIKRLFENFKGQMDEHDIRKAQAIKEYLEKLIPPGSPAPVGANIRGNEDISAFPRVANHTAPNPYYSPTQLLMREPPPAYPAPPRVYQAPLRAPPALPTALPTALPAPPPALPAPPPALPAAPAALPPAAPPAPIIITPTSIPTFTRGVPISPITFTASGPGPYTWATINLPLGLQLVNGILSGTPTVFGTGTFTITATNLAARFGSAIISYVIKKPFSFTEPMEFTAPVFVGGLLRSFSSAGGLLPPFFINDVLVQVNGQAGFVKFVIKADNFIFSTPQGEVYKNNTVREGNTFSFYISRIGTKRTLVAARGTGPTWTLQIDKITTAETTTSLASAAAEANLDKTDGFQKGNPIIKITFKGANPPPPVMIDVNGVTNYTTSEGEVIEIPPGTAPKTVADYVKAALLPGVRSPSSNQGQQGGRKTKKRSLKKKTRKNKRR
jgi:hypothetical protein